MTQTEAFNIIKKIYEHDSYRASKAPKGLSATSLLGGLYKAGLRLNKAPENKDLVDLKFKRSSTIGTAFHEYAEKIMKKEDNAITELYNERNIDDVVISGTCDLLVGDPDDVYTILDYKTGYGKERKSSDLNKDRLQMSIYRWINHNKIIDSTAYTLFVSQSNNVQEAYPLDLMSLNETQEFIEDKLYAIENNTKCDCFDTVKYNPCQYCSYICEHRKK